MMRANRSTLVKLCLLTALAIPAQRAAAVSGQVLGHQADRIESASRLLAQADTEPSFKLPASLEGADTLQIDGSSSMRPLNDALTERFTSRYEDASVNSEANGTDIALERLQNGEIDLASIGRPLTAEEKDAGLSEVAIAREKIAIFVSQDNPFSGDVNFEEFSQLFRGEITDWSEVDDGSGSGPVRFIDRPEDSDTRQAFSQYPAFKTAPFESGATADPVADETEAVIDALGVDGVGYAIANQVLGNPNIKIVPMHQVLPDNPAYPYSQPRNYVYQGEPTPAVQGFLAVATSPEGQEVVAEVQDTEGAAAAQLEGPAATATSADGALTARTDENNVAIIEDAEGNLVAGPLAGAGGAVTALAFSPDGQTLATGTNTGKARFWNTADGEPLGEAFPVVLGDDSAVTDLDFQENDKLFVGGSQGRQGLWGLNGLPFGDTAAPVAGAAGVVTETGGGLPGWLWWIIPLLGVLGIGALWLLGRRRTTAVAEPKRQTAPTATVPPPATDPDSDREVTSRAHSVISTDRVVDESRGENIPVGAVGSTPTQPLPVGEPGLDTGSNSLELESTDLESPELEGTNLDLLTPGALGVGAAALGGVALAAGSSADVESDADDDDEWDDNLDLTLDDEPTVIEPTGTGAVVSESTLNSPPDSPPDSSPDSTSGREDPALDLPEPNITGTAATPPPLRSGATSAATTSAAATISDDDFWNTAPNSEASRHSETDSLDGPSADLSNIDAIEPTRETVIAETDTVLDIEPDQNTIIGESTVIFGGAAAATGIAAGAAQSLNTDGSEATGTDTAATAAVAAQGVAGSQPTANRLSIAELASVDDGLADLPDGYGESRIVLLPRDPKWAYAYWDISNEHKEELRQQGGQRLMLRLYDVTDVDQANQAPHSMQQQDCNEMARSWYVEIPVSDRDYTAEIGYLTADERWLMLARSAPIRVPPIYPSDWIKDQFVTIGFDDSLAGRSFGDLGHPDEKLAGDSPATGLSPLYGDLFALTQSQEAMRVAGSLFGSMHQTGVAALSPSGMASGLNMSGLNVSGLNMSGVGLNLPRNFWLVADAELIVYGATEPNATVTIGDQVIPLNPDGTFRFHMHFPDGRIEYPIRAVAIDGEQSRSVTMNFERETPERNTNTKAEAKDEWF